MWKQVNQVHLKRKGEGGTIVFFIAGWIVYLISGSAEYPYIIERLKNKRETRYV